MGGAVTDRGGQDDGEAGGGSLRSQLGPLAERRGQPRLGTTAGAAGALLVFSGAMTIAFDASAGGDDGDGSSLPGTLISLLVVVAGYVVLAVRRHGAIATGGLVAFAVALPFFIGYATFEEGGFPPISIDAVLALSTVGWAAAYGLGPSRGHPFLLGSALLDLWWFLLEQVTGVFSAPFDFFGSLMFGFGEPEGPFGVDGLGVTSPDPTEIAVVSALFAAGYLVISRRLEVRGLIGMATPFVVVGHVAAILAVLTVADDLQEIGTGIVAMLVGAGLLWRGAVSGRRATTWLGAIYLTGGGQTLVSGITDAAVGAGVLLVGLGAVVVLAGHLVTEHFDEPEDTEPGPSFAAVRIGSGVTDAAGGEEAGDASTSSGVPSISPEGPGWWQASDGNWYPPELRPDQTEGDQPK